MAKYILAFLLGFSCFLHTTVAQPVFNISGLSSTPGEIVEIDFVVSDFDSIISMQFSVNWDETVLKFDSLKNVSTALPGLSAANFGTNPSNVDNGDMTLSWLEPSFSPANLSDGTTMFTVQFEVVGDSCDLSSVSISGDPLDIEVAQGVNETQVGLIANNGFVSIPGTNCGMSDGLKVTVSMESGEPGQNVCVQFVSEGFDDIGSLQFSLNFDSDVLSYDKVQNFNIPGLSSGNFGTTNAANGEITFLWFDSNAQGVTLPDGTILFEICFDITGAGGQMSPISFADTPLQIEVANGDGETLDFEGVPGKVTVIGVLEGFALILPDTIAAKPDEIICAPVTINDFTDIISMQFSINWDPTIMMYDHVEGFNLPDMDENSFGNPSAPGVDPGQMTVLWFDFSATGVSLANGTEIFTVCFKMIGDCDASTEIEFTSDPLALEISDADEILSVTEIEGIGVVDCEGGDCGFNIDAVNDPLCSEDSTGSILITVFGCTEPVTYSWSNGAATQDLFNVPAGVYSVTISTGDNQFLIPEPFTLEDPDPISVSAAITNVVLGGDGAIDITVNGGTPPYTFLWDDDDMSTSEDLSGLDIGSYSVTITDLNKCEFIAGPYQVMLESSLGLSLDVTNVDCFGAMTGKVDLTVSSGTSPLTFIWSNGETTEDICDLGAGSYTVTVTDGDGTTGEISAEVLQSPSAITVTIDTTNETQAGNDGAIDVTVSGGAPQYDFIWNTGDMTEDLSDISAGEYVVTITDTFGCEVVETILITGVALVVSVESSDFNGFGISCFGECDGQLIASSLNGVGSEVYQWSNGETTQSISNLCAGPYTVTVTDGLGRVTEVSIDLSQPAELIVDVDVVCASGPGISDGVAMTTVAGGVSPYLYEWNDINASTTSTLQGQQAGQLILFVTDANNCENMQQVEICLDGVPCYDAISVITPNGDDKNDRFVIQCIFDFPNKLSVFNRWGGLEYEMDNYNNSWEGTDLDGDELVDGGYHWVLEVYIPNGEQRIFKGTVTLIRSLN